MKKYFFWLFLSAIATSGIIGYLEGHRRGYSDGLNEARRVIPTVRNLSHINTPLQYGDIIINGTIENPCDTPPCVSMWNGQHWIELK